MTVQTVPVPRTRRPVPSALRIAEPTLKGLVDIFKVLADESRLRILLALAADGELHVNALCEIVGQSQPAVSHHLCRLLLHGLVERRRDGKHNFYRVDAERVKTLLDQFVAGPGERVGEIQLPRFLRAEVEAPG